MPAKKPYCIVPINERPVRRDTRFVQNAALVLTGVLTGIAVMVVLSLFVQ